MCGCEAVTESDKNGQQWFNAYQNIDEYLFNELDKLDLEFPILKNNNKPHLNTIEAIKLLVSFNKTIINNSLVDDDLTVNVVKKIRR